jgi:hypothetical protein
LKSQLPGRQVFGVEREPIAANDLDQVFTIDVECEDVPLERGSLDLVLYGNVLEELVDPLAVLRRHRRLLRLGGIVLASIPNVQHHSILTALLRGDFQYETAGLLDATHVRFFTWSTVFKMFLDAGLVPEIVDQSLVPAPSELLQAVEPLLQHLGLHAARTRRYLDSYQYIFRGSLLLEPPAAVQPLTFAVCVNDEASLQTNLLASPCLRAGTAHELLPARGCRTIADGLNAAVARARHHWVVCVHQDVYLPEGWDRVLAARLAEAEARFGPIGVAGVIGTADGGPAEPNAATPLVGWVLDRDRLLRGLMTLPARAETLDELVLVLPRGTPLRFDSALGFHFYGADLCLQARERQLGSVAVEALCFHNQRSVNLPAEFVASGQALAKKWHDRLPIRTTCAVVDGRWLSI